jgi:hypothetical protein
MILCQKKIMIMSRSKLVTLCRFSWQIQVPIKVETYIKHSKGISELFNIETKLVYNVDLVYTGISMIGLMIPFKFIEARMSECSC